MLISALCKALENPESSNIQVGLALWLFAARAASVSWQRMESCSVLSHEQMLSCQDRCSCIVKQRNVLVFGCLIHVDVFVLLR